MGTPAQPLQLPESLRRLVSDGAYVGGEYHETGWTEPHPSQCRALVSQIRSALADFEAVNAPAPAGIMDRCLASLALGCAPRSKDGETETTWRARAVEYKRILGEFPADIWQQACDEWMTSGESGRWYPTIAELHAIMKAKASQRERYRQRLARMRDLATAKPAEPKAGPPRRYCDMSPEERAAFDARMAEFKSQLGATVAATTRAKPAEPKPLRSIYVPGGPGEQAAAFEREFTAQRNGGVEG